MAVVSITRGPPVVQESLRIVGLAFIPVVVALLLRARFRGGTVTISGDTVHIERRWHRTTVRRLRTPRVCDRSAEEEGARLRFATTRGWIGLRVDSNDAERLIRAANADPETVQEFLLAKWAPRPLLHALWLLWPLLTIAGGAIAIAGQVDLMVVMALSTNPWLWMVSSSRARSTRATIGREGLVLHGWRFRRVVRWSEVTAVVGPAERPGWGIPFAKQSVTVQIGSRRLRLWAAASSQTSQDATPDHDQTTRLYLAIQRAWEAAASDDIDVARSLLRRGRSLEEWRRGPSTGSRSSYRSESLGMTALVEQLENASAPREARLGAALALTATHDPEVLQRLRVVAHNTVDAPLGTALLRVANDAFDDAALADFESAGIEPKRAVVTLPEPSPGEPRARRSR
jgi:hypothetical protein